MSDDIVAQLWRVYGRGDKDAIRLASYAAEEIERLRAELAAERDAYKYLDEKNTRLHAERDELRALLRKSLKHVRCYGDLKLEDCIDRALKGDDRE